MLLGCRVVRGPDWKWGDQDGGEGGVGTIVNLERFSDDKKLPSRTALVCWDIGCVADYRVGLDGGYDLRIFDSAPAGVRHQRIYCDSCHQNPLAGMRWRCLQCDDYDLCTLCYMNGSHDTNHEFLRFDKPDDESVPVCKRSQATRIQCKGLFHGAQVKCGRDWNDDSELRQMTGLVVGLKAWDGVHRSAVTVKWGDCLEVDHRLGHKGKVDVVAVKASKGIFYYKEHLPVAANLHANFERFASTGGEQLKEGDRVTIHLDVETLKTMADGHGGWAPGMEKSVGKIGKIVKIDEDGDVHVDFGSMKWAFYPEALVKIHSLRTGDKVRVLANKQLVINYQEGHGGWNNAMEKALGEQGVVMGIDNDGDAIVNVDSQHWVFNTAALILESKEHERQPAGSGAVGVDQGELLMNILLEGLASSLSSLSSGNTIEQLMLAATVGKLDKVKQIIQKDRSLLNKKSNNNKTALHVACHQGHPEVVSFLLEAGADKEIKDEGGHTALHHAAYGDKSGACVMLLLTANANVNIRDEKTKSTPLHLAVQRDNEKAAEALTKFQHCDANLQDKDGDTPLHLTVMLGQNKNAKTILDNCRETGLDPSIFNQKGFNVLHLACIKNDIEIARILINRYPGLACMGKDDGFFPIHLTALNNRVEIAKMLLQSGHCNVNEVNKEGRTALSIAVGESYSAMIELLITNNANPNKEDNDGDTPLHIAIMKHAMSFLGLDLSIFSNRTPDASVTKELTQAIPLYLVVNGADVNHRNHQGKTPMELCIHADLQKRIEGAVRTAPGSPPAITIPPTSPPVRTAPVSLPTASAPTSPPAIQPTQAPLPKPVPKPKPRSRLPPALPPKQHRPTSVDVAKKMSSNVYSEPRPVVAPLGAGLGPTSPDITVPPTLCDGVAQNNEDDAAGGKKSNNQMSSDIQVLDEQNVKCRLCNEEQATVLFEPCNHTVLCHQCSRRAKVCMQCNMGIENKVVPDGVPYRSLTDLKKDFESRISKLEREKDDLAREKDDLERIAYCQICMERPHEVVFLPCRHRSCKTCFTKLKSKCPNCNQKIVDTLTFY